MTEQKAHLVRGIGTLGGSFIVLNGMIGAGIFALPPAVAERLGVMSPWLFLAAGVLIILVVLSFAELASYFRASGGPALYATQAFGPVIGFGTSWIYYISRTAAIAANSHALALYLGGIWAWFDTSAGHSAVIIVFCGGLTLINVMGVKDSVRTLTFFTFFKVIPLLLLIVLGMQFVNVDVLFPDVLPTVDDPGGTALLLFYAYIGFEAVMMTAGETKSPRRTIPNMLVRTVIATAILYFLIMLVYVAVMANDTSQGATLADVARKIAGPVGAMTITVAAIFSIGGNLAASLLSGPRLSLSLAEQGLLPQWFGRVHDDYSTPANSIMFLGGISMIIALSGSFVFLAIASSLARLIVYMVCIAALPVIKKKADAETVANAFKVKGGYTVPVIALGLCGWMASHSSLESWKFLFGLLAVGLVLYWIEKFSAKKSAQEP